MYRHLTYSSATVIDKMAAFIDTVEEMPVLDQIKSAAEEEQLNRSMETGDLLAEYLVSPGKALDMSLTDEMSSENQLDVSKVSDEADSSMVSSSTESNDQEAVINQPTTPKVGSKQWMDTVFPAKDAAIARNKLSPVQYSATGKPVTTDHNVIIVENGRKLMQHFDKDEKWRNIFLIKNKDGLGLNMPEEGFGIDDVIEIMGATHTVSTIDVYEQHSRDMTLDEFRSLQQQGENPYNILSLEFSKTELANFVSPPDVYRMMSLAEFYWPENADKKTAARLVDPKHRDLRPRVERFCLIGMGGSFTDFHIDFGGSSVWYHVFSGKKVFYVVPPTKENLDVYQRNEITKDQFLADTYGEQCWRVEILAGQTLIIPAGWIHAVYTPEDSIVFGGNFLTLNDMAMQCEVHAMERRHDTGKSFFYPEFELVNWYAARTLAAQMKAGKTLPPHHLEGAKALLSHLVEWKKIDKKGKKTERKFILADTKSAIVEKLRKALEGVTDDLEAGDHLMDRSITSHTRKRRGSSLGVAEPKRPKVHAYVVPVEKEEPEEDLEELEDVDPTPPTPKETPRPSRAVERQSPKESPVEASRVSRSSLRQTPKENPSSAGKSRERRGKAKDSQDKSSEEDLINQLLHMGEKVERSEAKMKANEKKMRENRKAMEEMEEKLREYYETIKSDDKKMRENRMEEMEKKIREYERKIDEMTKSNEKMKANEKKIRENKRMMEEMEEKLKEYETNKSDEKTRENRKATEEMEEKMKEYERRIEEMTKLTEKVTGEAKKKERNLEMREMKMNEAEEILKAMSLKTEEEEKKMEERRNSLIAMEKEMEQRKCRMDADMEEREKRFDLRMSLKQEAIESKMQQQQLRMDAEMEERERVLIEREKKVKEDESKMEERERLLNLRIKLKIEASESKLAQRERTLDERERKANEAEGKMEEREKAFNEKMKLSSEEEENKINLKRKEHAAEMEERERLFDLKIKLKIEGSEMKMAQREQALNELESRERSLTDREAKIQDTEKALGEMKSAMDAGLKREKEKLEQDMKMKIEEELKIEKLLLETSMEQELRNEKVKLQTSMEQELKTEKSKLEQDLKASMNEELKCEKSKLEQELKASMEQELKTEKSRLEQDLKTSMEDEITLRISEVQEEKRLLEEMREEVEEASQWNVNEKKRLDAVRTELREARVALTDYKDGLDEACKKIDEERAELEAAKKAMKDFKKGDRLAKEQKAFHARMQEEWAQLEREKERDEKEREELEEERRAVEEQWRRLEEAGRGETLGETVEQQEEAQTEAAVAVVNEVQQPAHKEIKEEQQEQDTLMIEPPVQLERPKEAEKGREVKQEEPEESPEETNQTMMNTPVAMPSLPENSQMERNPMEDMTDAKPLLDGKRRRKSTKMFEPNPHQSIRRSSQMDNPVIVGVVYIVVSAICIMLNCLTIRAIFTQGKLRKNHSAMYIIYLQPLITDVIYQMNYLFYHAPSVIIQNYLFAPPVGKQITFILDSIQTYCWFNNSLSQISLALNRFIVTVLLRLNFFTRDRAIVLSAVQHLLAISIAVIAQLALPCCILHFDFAIFSYHEVYLPGVPNYSWTHLKLPVQIACSAIPLVLYTTILLTTRAIGRQLKLQSRELIKRRSKELKFTVQFASIASLYTLSWVAFAVVPGEAFAMGWLRCLAAVLGILNATTNAIVFLLNDSKKLCSFCVASSPGGSTN